VQAAQTINLTAPVFQFTASAIDTILTFASGARDWIIRLRRRGIRS
jgi:hypothetical protein